MLISTIQLKTQLRGKESISVPELLKMIEVYEQEQAEERPFATASAIEQALIVYCTPKLYDFVGNLNTEEDINIISLGKVYLEIKKFFKGGRSIKRM